MMRVDAKRLGDSARAWLDGRGQPIEVTDRQTAKLDMARAVSRRQQALLAAAGESEPVLRRWYVLTIAGGEDILVDNALTNAGVEHWMAVEKLATKWRGGRKHQRFCAVVKPFFPGYMFVRVAWGEMTWHGLDGVNGVSGIVGGAMNPAPLSDKEFDKFRWHAENDPKFLKAMRNALDVGDLVRIDEGPFAHFEAVLVQLCEESARVRVEVELFGRATPVDLDLAQITKVE
jgi:transcriptional antiterminator NusG